MDSPRIFNSARKFLPRCPLILNCALLVLTISSANGADPRPKVVEWMEVGPIEGNQAVLEYPKLEAYLSRGRKTFPKRTGFNLKQLEEFMRVQREEPEQFHPSDISRSSPENRIFLAANMGRLQEAFRIGRQLSSDQDSKRYLDKRYFESLAVAAMEAGDLQAALEFVAMCEEDYPKNQIRERKNH